MKSILYTQLPHKTVPAGTKNLSRKGENLENTKKKEFTTRSPTTPLRVARDAENTERD
jgi:hypothetical protein